MLCDVTLREAACAGSCSCSGSPSDRHSIGSSAWEVRHDRVEFALLTARWLKATEAPITNPLHHDIHWGCCPFKLKPVTTNVTVRVPSLHAIEFEKNLERQRSEQIAYQQKVAQQIESEFERREFLARRPLPPSGLK
ncbi:hypothetical protein lerEdw1_002408 [Lerista edwardsae]|nr:hypothetical protein lerEdw1_002408 [Lerista edwardsae]